MAFKDSVCRRTSMSKRKVKMLSMSWQATVAIEVLDIDDRWVSP